MTTRVTEGASAALARACTPLTKSEEKERMLAVLQAEIFHERFPVAVNARGIG